VLDDWRLGSAKIASLEISPGDYLQRKFELTLTRTPVRGDNLWLDKYPGGISAHRSTVQHRRQLIMEYPRARS